jgi:hypothetical protein
MDAHWETNYRALITAGEELIVFEVWQPTGPNAGQWVEKLFHHSGILHSTHPPYMNGFHAYECEGRHNHLITEGNPTFFAWPTLTIENALNKNTTYRALNALITHWRTQNDAVQLNGAGIVRFSRLPTNYVVEAAQVAPNSNGGSRRPRRRRKRRKTRRKRRRKRRRKKQHKTRRKGRRKRRK